MTINELHNVLRPLGIPMHTKTTTSQQRKTFGLQEIIIRTEHAYIQISSIKPNVYHIKQVTTTNSHNIKNLFNKILHYNEVHQIKHSDRYVKDSINNFIKTPIKQRDYNYSDVTNVATLQSSRFDLLHSICDYNQRHVIYPMYDKKNLTVNHFDDAMFANGFKVYINHSNQPNSDYGNYDIQADNKLVHIEISAIQSNTYRITYQNNQQYDFAGEPATDFISVDTKSNIHQFIHTSILKRDYQHAMITDKHKAYNASNDLLNNFTRTAQPAQTNTMMMAH